MSRTAFHTQQFTSGILGVMVLEESKLLVLTAVLETTGFPVT